MDRKPGQLVSRIRQDALTCDFTSIRDPLDEAMRTRFICSVKNETVLKALFKVKDDELTFARAIEIATETEDAAKVAKETVHGSKSVPPVLKLQTKKPKSAGMKQKECFRCGKDNHTPDKCRHKTSTCNYCQKPGHIEPACRSKREANSKIGKQVKTVKSIKNTTELCQNVCINGCNIRFEVDTGAGDNFMDDETWKILGKPKLKKADQHYESASKHPLPLLGSIQVETPRRETDGSLCKPQSIEFNVAQLPKSNLLGRDAIKKLAISVDALLGTEEDSNSKKGVKAVFDNLEPDETLQNECKKTMRFFPRSIQTRTRTTQGNRAGSQVQT
jgi:hypothetical protein